MTKAARHKLYIFLASLLALVVYYKWAFIGHYGYDDLLYTELAQQINLGRLDYGEHFAFRWGLIYPMAWSYRIFGFNDFAGSLPVFLYAVGILFLVYRMMHKKAILPLGLALLFTLLSKWNLAYAIKIMADIPLAFAATLAFYAYYHKKFQRGNNLFTALLLAAALLLGFMTKGTIILILPVFAFFFIYDLFQKQHLTFWLYAASFTILLFAAYFLLVKRLTGDMLMRFNAIAANSYLNHCSYGEQPTRIVLQRIAYQFWDMLLRQAMLLPIALSIAAALATPWKKFKQLTQEEEGFFLSITMLLLLSSNFMSISLADYNPMCLDPRHYLFITPFAAISSGYFVANIKGERAKLIRYGSLALLCLAFAFVRCNPALFRNYFMTFSLVALYGMMLYKRAKSFSYLFLLAFAFVLSFAFRKDIKHARNITYARQKQLCTAFLDTISSPAYIIADPVQQRWNRYFMAYQLPKNIQLLSLKPDSTKIDSSYNFYIINNPYTQSLSGLSKADMPYYFYLQHTKSQNLVDSKQPPLRIAKVGNILNPQKKVLIGTFRQDYESDFNLWKNPVLIRKEKAYAGMLCEEVIEYSSTLELALDSLPQFSNYAFHFTAMVNSPQVTSAGYVLSIVHGGKNIFWQQYGLNAKLKTYGSYWPYEGEQILSIADIPEGSTLKLYIWNKSKDPLFVDNLSLSIYGIP